MENRKLIAEWIRNPKMEATWGSKNLWHTFEEYCNIYKEMFFLKNNFEIRIRDTPINNFIKDFEKLCKENYINSFLIKRKQVIKRTQKLAEKHFGEKE